MNVERIATRDRLEFAHELFDRYAEEVYHYVLAWTGEQASAVDLTTRVLRIAVARMDQLAGGAGAADAAELEMRLIALVRAAVIKWRARRPGERPAAATAVPEDSMPLFEGLGELDDDQREVLVLCELLGHTPERAGRLLGYDGSVAKRQRDEALESLWRAVNDAPPERAVSTWERLTVDTALRRAAAGWLTPSDHAVLAYMSEQLLGEEPVGVPVTAPARGAAAAKIPAKAELGSGRPSAPPTAAPTPAPPAKATAGRPGAPAAPGAAAAKAAAKLGGPAAAAAKGNPAGSGEPSARPEGAAGKAVGRQQPERDGRQRWVAAGLAPLLRGRWSAWGIAAGAAAALGVVTALTMGGPVSGSSQCATRLACPPSTTVTAGYGDAGAVGPASTDVSGNNLPTSTGGQGGLGQGRGFPFRPATSSSTTIGRATSTTRRASATTTEPSRTTQPGPTTPPTTAPPPTDPPTTAPTTDPPPSTDPPPTTA